MISVIIPAHDEEAVLPRNLAPLAKMESAQVIVVANGCSDRTAEVARRDGGHALVIETDIPSKRHALNLGDRHATHWPRFYIDADVYVSVDTFRKMVGRLALGDILAVAPRPWFDLSNSSWGVRSFYLIDSLLPSNREGIGGSGVYGLTEVGRKRFGEFPDITADDAYVRRQFKPHERATLEDAWSVVTPPRTLTGLIVILTRAHYGNYELHYLFPDLTENRGEGNGRTLLRLMLVPRLWAALAVYVGVKLIARMRAYARFRTGLSRWERDDTSRQAQAGSTKVAH